MAPSGPIVTATPVASRPASMSETMGRRGELFIRLILQVGRATGSERRMTGFSAVPHGTG
jgi:hypothetical protein